QFASPPLKGRGGKLSYKDQRDLDRLPGEIERLEQEIERLEQEVSDPNLYSRDPARFAGLTGDIAELRAEKERAEQRWLEVAEMAEALAAGG
ncbi:MAG TPA: ABC transporter C-terminal domain-containing protein, partial [Sphingomicrobium sp.]|nr:ABC transporter C-terminal domain-containing protein [Sphingomicrobium sp.]